MITSPETNLDNNSKQDSYSVERAQRSGEKKAAQKFKTAKVAIIGRPNAGKSTLLNALVESELCATSNRPQTTRKNTRGIVQRYTGRKWTGQIVFIDTPGMNFQKGALERSFLNSVEEGLGDADVILWVADARTFEKDLIDLEMEKIQDDRVANWLQDSLQKSDPENGKKWILVLSKADLVDKGALLPLIEKSLKILPQFDQVVPVAATEGLKSNDSNLEAVLSVIDDLSPAADPLFPKDSYTDASAKELIREFIRETIFRNTMKEVPYECDCQVVMFKEAVGKLKPEVDAVIWTSRSSLKAILVGAQGQKIKEIGMTARKRYQELTGQEIILRIVVKVVDKWDRRADAISELGYGQLS